MDVFENKLLGRTFGDFREQATGDDIWIVFDKSLIGKHLEDFKDRLLWRIFGIFRGNATGEDI